MELVVGSFTPSVLLAVARQTGRLAAHGLAVTETSVSSSPAQFRALRDGAIDAALTSPDNVVAYRYVPDNPLRATMDARIVSAVDRGMGLGLYARPGLPAARLRGARVGVDVPTSGFALALYALAESLGVTRPEYDVVALGSTPNRLTALLAGDCDVTMLNAGNELFAERRGAVLLARAGDVCTPYLGTVLSVVGEQHLAPALDLARALRETAREICDGTAAAVAVAAARSGLGLPDDLAHRYLARLRSPSEGLVRADGPDRAGLTTVVELRRRYLPCVVDGTDVLAPALAAGSGLVVDVAAGP